MFCEGLSLDFTGLVTAAGGNTDAATSAYDSTANAWTAKAVSFSALLPPTMSPWLTTNVFQPMNIPRGYQAQATTSTGNLFTIGASWSGGQGGKNGELYSPSANTWTQLPGAVVAPMLTADAQGMKATPFRVVIVSHGVRMLTLDL